MSDDKEDRVDLLTLMRYKFILDFDFLYILILRQIHHKIFDFSLTDFPCA